MLAGFYGGLTDALLSRLMDVVLSFPVLLLGLGLGAACSVRGCLSGTIEPGIGTVIAIIAFVNWTYIARVVRGQVLSLREQEFVAAARSLGASSARILGREILPEPARAADRLRDAPDPSEHPARGRPVVPQRRRPPADAQLGADDRGRDPYLPDGMVVHGFSGAGPADHRAGLQPARRRAAGRSGPEDGP